MIVQTRFGTFPATPSDVIQMVVPLPGFESCRRFLLLSSADITPFVCLHGIDPPNPTFLAIETRLVDPHFRCVLSDADRQRLSMAGDGDPRLWLAIVTMSDAGATANMQAPVVINAGLMLGLQVIPVESTYPVAHPLTAG